MTKTTKTIAQAAHEGALRSTNPTVRAAAERKVLEVIYQAGHRHNLVRYFAGEDAYIAWLNSPVAEDPNFDISRATYVSPAQAVDAAAAIQARSGR